MTWKFCSGNSFSAALSGRAGWVMERSRQKGRDLRDDSMKENSTSRVTLLIAFNYSFFVSGDFNIRPDWLRQLSPWSHCGCLCTDGVKVLTKKGNRKEKTSAEKKNQKKWWKKNTRHPLVFQSHVAEFHPGAALWPAEMCFFHADCQEPKLLWASQSFSMNWSVERVCVVTEFTAVSFRFWGLTRHCLREVLSGWQFGFPVVSLLGRLRSTSRCLAFKFDTLVQTDPGSLPLKRS